MLSFSSTVVAALYSCLMSNVVGGSGVFVVGTVVIVGVIMVWLS